ncbi:hypothetical protein ACJRPK_14155 [Aquimarina sp. 2-A2]|uniref:hypothetical protein n=1 Tax=Aquimarina sp. 2-A2 TaxID=3382644 RepID=UPI00387EEF8D
MKFLAVLSILALTIASCATPNLNEESGQELQDFETFTIDKGKVQPPGGRDKTVIQETIIESEVKSEEAIDKEKVQPPGSGN